MSNYSNLLATIAANVYPNNNNEVTAAMVKAACNSIVSELGAGYQFMGVATTSTNPGATDNRVFYLAFDPGTYMNFNNTKLKAGQMGIFYYGSAWTYSVKTLFDGEGVANPILMHQANQEIWWRGTARLFWNPISKQLYFGSGSTQDADNAMVIFRVGSDTVKLTAAVKTREITVTGNQQLLLPRVHLAVYDLDDIVILNGTSYDETQYIKLAHLTFGDAISSFVIEQAVESSDDELTSLPFSLVDGFNYSRNVLTGRNIGADGIMTNYSGRGAVFFKLAGAGVPSKISGCTILAYQWYSGFPDYVSGSNSLGRTNTNTPPASATYCGITINTGNDYSNLYISPAGAQDRAAMHRYGSALNNSVGESLFSAGAKDTLNILAYGNSFMRNSVAYLGQLAAGAGVNLTVGNLYTGGTELQDHLAALKIDNAVYEYHRYEGAAETISQTNQKPSRGLKDRRWDAVIVHQYIPWQYPFEPTLNEFLRLIVETIGYAPKIYINATWAGSLDGGDTYYGYATEAEMWAAMLDYVKRACEDAGILEYSIIPTGTAIQNARTLAFANSYNRFVNAAPDLHHLNPAGGFVAACAVYEKIVAPLCGVHCTDTSFRIDSATALPPSNDVQAGILVTDSNYLQLCQSAIDAVAKPYVITNIS